MKARVYGFCDAGCKRETVFKEDFDRIASVIKQSPDADGKYKLNPLNAYKVHTTKTDGKYQATFTLQGGGVNHDFKYTEFDEYRDYIIFEILILASNENATGLTIVYEINGNRYREQLGGYAGLLDVSKIKLHITEATEVYSYNNNAEIIADNQQTYDTAVGSEGEQCPATLPTDELFTSPAAMYAGQRMPTAGDLLYYRYTAENSKGQNIMCCKITRVEADGVYMQALYFAQGTGSSGSGGGISDVQVNGTSVVADGVANIPEASATQAGVVTTGLQEFAGVKTFKNPTIKGSNSVSIGCQIVGMLHAAKGFATGTPSTTTESCARYEQDHIRFDLKGTGKPYITSASYGADKGADLYLPYDRTGEFMVVPYAWSTGISGIATLPEAGLYEIKATYENRLYHFVVCWDGTPTTSEMAPTDTQAMENGIFVNIYPQEGTSMGLIALEESALNGGGGGTISTQISFRKIGIA